MIIGSMMHPAPVFVCAGLLLVVAIVSFYFFIKINRHNKVVYDKRVEAYKKEIEDIRRREEEKAIASQRKEMEQPPAKAPEDKLSKYARSVQFMAPNGASYDVPMIDSITIGRNPRCNLFIKDPTVADLHCKILYTDEGYLIQDLGTEGGTFIDGIRVPMNSVQELKTGVLQMGKVTFFITVDSNKS
ncbi:MAG: FHA domain-containing protein [Clostridiales bacterium]|nr:FHA domain-containing protein [Clostridiales bacterium]